MSLIAQNIKRSMKDYNEILCLYRSSFPETERFPVWLLPQSGADDAAV